MKLRTRTLSILLALFLTVPFIPAQAHHAGAGTHFGLGNLPAGCTTQFTEGPHFTDACFHMRTNLNALDTHVIDVLLVTPATPYPERDLRAMRQAVEMWAEGIHYLAPQMGLDWLKEVDFNIFLDNDKFTTDPLWDPEIIVVAANPVVAGVQGIGIDPLHYSAPCRGANPLASFEAWQALPGFDGHDPHGGTYVERCEGGGTTCYAVNLAIDPVPGVIDDVLNINMFDLVAHEVGHCLSVGHVGDALDHTANAVPEADIMSYTGQPHFKCVSTLDVESFALRMSRFLLPTPLTANDAQNPDGAFQVQHPKDHYYASATGFPEDCPQPDVGLVPPGAPASFTPQGGFLRSPPALDITSHANGANVSAGLVTIAGTVLYGNSATDQDSDGVTNAQDNCPTTFNPDQRDGDGDGIGDRCDDTDGPFPIPSGAIRGGITIFNDRNPAVAHSELATLGTEAAGDAKPKFFGNERVTFRSRFSTDSTGTVVVGTSTFTWHIWDATGAVVATIPCTTVADSSAAGGSGFDCRAKTALPSEPGFYYASARLDASNHWIRDSPATDLDHPGLKGFEILPAALPEALASEPATAVGLPALAGRNAQTIVFEDDGDPVNTFYTEESTFGQTGRVGLDATEEFTLTLTVRSDVKFRLEWTSLTEMDDLDLVVSGVVSDSSAEPPGIFEELAFQNVQPGTITIRVIPYAILDPAFGATYTLVAEVTPLESEPDEDGDGVPDSIDACPGTPPGTPVDATGCPIGEPPGERVEISIDGIVLATENVTGDGGDTFSQAIDLTGRSGLVTVTVTWYDGQYVMATRTLDLNVQ